MREGGISRVHSSALRADAEEFQFVVKIAKAGFFADFVFQLVDGAGSFDGLDAAAAGADEVVAVAAGDEQGEVGGAFMQAEAADDAMLGEALQEAENGGFVALVGESLRGGELGESHWASAFEKRVEQFL